MSLMYVGDTHTPTYAIMAVSDAMGESPYKGQVGAFIRPARALS